MAKKAKQEKKLSFETDLELEEERKLKLRPEDVVRAREEFDSLPSDYNPYGANYIVEKPKFLGDEPPFEQFHPDGYKLWEVINDGDDTLKPVYFSMPRPPAKELIDNYGLPQEEQFFRRAQVPRKFKLIEQKALQDLAEIEAKNRQDTIQGYKFYLRFWELIEQEEENLEEELNWLKRIWWWRTYGYWYYNDGEPTFIPPDYFDFLNFYFIQEALCYPEYRDDVRRKYCFSWYLEQCTETFKDYDNSGRAVKNKEGKYEMIDLGRRLFFGDIEPKTRRTGATHEAIHKLLKGAMTNLSFFATIISFEGDSARSYYNDKLLPAFDEFPMVLKPMWEGNRRPKILRLDAPPNVYMVRGLKSSLTYSDSSGLFKNDGKRLNGVLNDEGGKCFRFGTEIIMANGDIRQVQDIKNGDYVMGDDGSPRLVSGVTCGYGKMYEVSSKFGVFGCNEDHVLSLRTSSKGMLGCKSAGTIMNIPLKDVINLGAQTKRNLKLYKKPIVYEKRNVALDPYFLGLWLGDGTHSAAEVTNIDEEIISWLKDYARSWGAKLQTTQHKCHRISFNSTLRGNPIKTYLKRMNLLYNKHIPSNYLKNTEEIRMQLLAGLIDTDGSRSPNDKKLAYEIVQKRKILAEQICQLANSLGFWSKIEEKVATMKRSDGSVYRCDVYRVKIYGDIYKIPVKVKRKQYLEPTGFRNKTPNVSWFEIDYVGMGNYYGFAVDGNHLFLLANQVVVHNSTNQTADIFERWHVNKFTMSTGMGINILKGAYVKNPSTVEQMEDGSVPYKKMCDLSDFYVRIPGKGQTPEGFARLFLPAYLRMEGYIDRFGKSVVEKPTERQKRLMPNAIFAQNNKGAKEDLQAERDALLSANTPEALQLYRSVRRKSPFTYSECWLGSAGDVGIDMEIVDRRMSDLGKLKSLGKPPYRTGFFRREDVNNPYSKVIWIDSVSENKFDISLYPPDALTNQMVRCDYFDPIKGEMKPSWRPVNGWRFTMGVDGFRNIKKNDVKAGKALTGNFSNSRQSDGGIAVKWEYDDSVDKGKKMDDWESDRCVLTYRYRPSTQDEFFEDVIMAAQFFGAMIYPEYNVERIVDYVIDRGYWGFFLYDINIMTGKPNAMPGKYTSGDTWDGVFSLFKDYIKNRGHKECHDKLLNELKKIRGSESMTHLDLASAFGMSLLGGLSQHRKIISKGTAKSSVDLAKIGIFKRRSY